MLIVWGNVIHGLPCFHVKVELVVCSQGLQLHEEELMPFFKAVAILLLTVFYPWRLFYLELFVIGQLNDVLNM